MDPQLQSTCIFPLELVDIIIAFAKELSYTGDANKVFPKEHVLDKVYTHRRKAKEQNNKRPVPLLLNLSLVCRAWLVLSRKHLSFGRTLFLNINHKPDHIERFVDILSEGNRLPDFPNMLSFVTSTKIQCPYHLSNNLSKLLKEMSNRETSFCPQRLHLIITDSLSRSRDVFPLVSSVYSTITILWIDSPYARDIIRLLTSFPKLEIYNGLHPMKEMHFNMSQHRLPDSLHTMAFDFWNLPSFGPRVNKDSNLLPFTEWLQSHPPAHNMCNLELRWGASIDVEFIQAFLDICPNLDTLTFGTRRDRLEQYSEDWVESSVFDLSSVTTLHDLTFDVVPLLDYRNCGGRQILEAVGLVLQTVELSKATITLRLDINRCFRCYDVGCLAKWCTTIDQAMSELPQDVTLTILALHSWKNNQEKEASIVDDFRTMLPRTQEQSKLKVVTEIAVFPDDE